MTTYRLTSAALSELREATLYYERKEPGLGLEFLDEIDDTVDRIVKFPRAWRPLSARTRRCRTHRTLIAFVPSRVGAQARNVTC